MEYLLELVLGYGDDVEAVPLDVVVVVGAEVVDGVKNAAEVELKLTDVGDAVVTMGVNNFALVKDLY